MALKLMYITNRPEVAEIAEQAGVDRIFVDMEYIGKEMRQAGLDTVKSHHTVYDIKRIKETICKAELLVRINPIHAKTNVYIGTKNEINAAIEAGADILMLPMFKTVQEVKEFIELVNGRAKTMLLIETPEAVKLIREIVRIEGVDEIHIGLNDLHLALHKKFMFELLVDGTVERICSIISDQGIPYGFGGIARLGYGALPAEYVITEHYRLGSTIAILSRSFCNANTMERPDKIVQTFCDGVKMIREWEKKVNVFTDEQFEENRLLVNQKVHDIIK